MSKLVGSLKPDKVKMHKMHNTVSGITPAGTSKLKAHQGKVPIDNVTRIIPQQARES